MAPAGNELQGPVAVGTAFPLLLLPGLVADGWPHVDLATLGDQAVAGAHHHAHLCVPWVPRCMHCILPSSTGGKEGAFWALEDRDGSGIHWGHHLPSRTGKDTAGICVGAEVTGYRFNSGP